MLTAMRPESEKGGYIIRTSAEEGATEEEFRDDMAYLGRSGRKSARRRV